MSLIVDVPINNLSFGNVGVNILRELFNRQIPISLFPRGGQKDLSAFNKLPEDFKSWIDQSEADRYKSLEICVQRVRCAFFVSNTHCLFYFGLSGCPNILVEGE